MTDEVAIEQEQPDPKPKANVPAIAMGSRGVQLTTIEDAYRFAEAVYQSGLAPKGLASPQAILIAVQMGAEVGLPPMAALQNVAVINGRPSIWGDAMLAICRGSGRFDEEAFEETITGEGDQMQATCTVRRIPGKAVTRTFSVQDAKTAGLWGKQGPWQQYPKRMLQCRARSWALRDAFADVLRGFSCAEEMRDVIDVPSRPVPSSLDELREQMEAAASPPESDAEAAVEESNGQTREMFLADLAACDGIRQVSGVLDEYVKRFIPPLHEWAKQKAEDRKAEIRAARGAGSNKPAEGKLFDTEAVD